MLFLGMGFAAETVLLVEADGLALMKSGYCWTRSRASLLAGKILELDPEHRGKRDGHSSHIMGAQFVTA